MNTALIIFCDYIFQCVLLDVSIVSLIVLLNLMTLSLLFSIVSFTGFTGAQKLYTFISYMLYNQTGKLNNSRFVNLVVSLFLFVLISNLSGILPFGIAPTGQLVVPVYLSFFLFLFLVDVSVFRDGIYSCIPTNKGGSKSPFLVKVLFPETIVRLSQPFSLSVRLFSNMLAGHFLLSVVMAANRLYYLMDFIVILISFPFIVVLSIVLFLFELIVSFLQSYVFVLLTVTYLSTGSGKANY